MRRIIFVIAIVAFIATSIPCLENRDSPLRGGYRSPLRLPIEAGRVGQSPKSQLAPGSRFSRLAQMGQPQTVLFTMLNGVLRDSMPMVNASLVAVVLKAYPDKDASFVNRLYDVIQGSSGLSAVEKLQEFNRRYPDDALENIPTLAAEANELKKTLSKQVPISSFGQRLLELFQHDLSYTISVDHPGDIEKVEMLSGALGHTQEADYDKFSHIERVLSEYPNVENIFLVFDAVSEIRKACEIADKLKKQGKHVHVIGITYSTGQLFQSLSDALKAAGADIVLSGLSQDLSQITELRIPVQSQPSAVPKSEELNNQMPARTRA